MTDSKKEDITIGLGKKIVTTVENEIFQHLKPANLGS